MVPSQPVSIFQKSIPQRKKILLPASVFLCQIPVQLPFYCVHPFPKLLDCRILPLYCIELSTKLTIQIFHKPHIPDILVTILFLFSQNVNLHILCHFHPADCISFFHKSCLILCHDIAHHIF